MRTADCLTCDGTDTCYECAACNGTGICQECEGPYVERPLPVGPSLEEEFDRLMEMLEEGNGEVRS